MRPISPVSRSAWSQGNRYQWSSSTTDVRALESPDQSTRKATCWYASSQLELQLSFSSAYSGNLELYALDWDSTSRRETISVNDGSSPQAAALTTSFNEGAWMVFPISVASGGTVTITVQLTGGANAVLSGIFLGGPGIAVSSAPQGNWVGSYGGSGYALAAWNGSSDATYLPGVTLSLVEGNRYQWSSSTTDVRALESPDQSTREATCWYASSQLELQLSFSSSYSGNLELYALDWDSTSRRETISVNDGSSPQAAALTTSFNEGAWMVFPISVASGGTVTITVQLTGGANAVLSGIFLGGPGIAVSSAPQGNWVGTYGGSGYALGGLERRLGCDLPPRCHAQLGRRQPLPVELLDHRRTCPRERRPVDPRGDLLVRELAAGAAALVQLGLQREPRALRPRLGLHLPQRDDQRERRFLTAGGRPHHLLQRRSMDGVPHQRRVRRHGDHHRSADRWSQRCAVGDLPGLRLSLAIGMARVDQFI